MLIVQSWKILYHSNLCLHLIVFSSCLWFFIFGNMFYFKVVNYINNCLCILCLLYLKVLEIFSFVLLQEFKSFVLEELEYLPFLGSRISSFLSPSNSWFSKSSRQGSGLVRCKSQVSWDLFLCLGSFCFEWSDKITRVWGWERLQSIMRLLDELEIKDELRIQRVERIFFHQGGVCHHPEIYFSKCYRCIYYLQKVNQT